VDPPLILDLIVAAVVVIALVRGWSHGSIREAFGLLGLLLGILAASLLVAPLASAIESLFSMDVNVARVTALGIIVGAVSLGFGIAGVRTATGIEIPGPRWLDSLGGAIFGLMRSITLVVLFLYGTIGVSTSERGVPGLGRALDESFTGAVLADESSPLTTFYDALLTRSDDLRALTLWVRQSSVGQGSTFQDEVSADRLDFDGTNGPLEVSPQGERKMLQLLNEEREEDGLDPLGWCGDCSTVARKHSRDMYRNGYFSHIDLNGDDPFERMREAKIDYLAAGENLAIAPTIDEGHAGLMASPDHRANILRPVFNEVGIGCFDGPYGLICTQVFREAPA
jgi:uncharacterized protein YkwD/uncharacterized membrane protein required for colicin V production